MTTQTTRTAQTSQTGRAAQIEQGALFGDPALVDDPTAVPVMQKAATQDVELVASVVRAAGDPGYRVIERSGRVFRVDPAAKGSVEAVPRYEAETVIQLLDARLLELGGNHTITVGRHSGPSRSVLVPKDTRNRVARWSNLRPLPASVRTDTAPDQGREGAGDTSGPIGVDVVRPGRGLVTCREFSGELIRESGRYLVETEFGHVVGRAASYRAGAHMLARHHGYTPGPVEIEHEHRIFGRD